MKAECRVSVIVPVYRVEGYLDRCIRSLMKQTLTEIEILCICEKEDPSYQRLLTYGKTDIRIRVIEKKIPAFLLHEMLVYGWLREST